MLSAAGGTGNPGGGGADEGGGPGTVRRGWTTTIPSCQHQHERAAAAASDWPGSVLHPPTACIFQGPGPNQRRGRDQGLAARSPPLQQTGASDLRERGSWGGEGVGSCAPPQPVPPSRRSPWAPPGHAAFSRALARPKGVPLAPSHPFPRLPRRLPPAHAQNNLELADERRRTPSSAESWPSRPRRQKSQHHLLLTLRS